MKREVNYDNIKEFIDFEEEIILYREDGTIHFGHLSSMVESSDGKKVIFQIKDGLYSNITHFAKIP